MFGNGAIVRRASSFVSQAIKTGSGSRNKAARVGMLALFQNEVRYSHGQIATSIVSCPHCLTLD